MISVPHSDYQQPYINLLIYRDMNLLLCTTTFWFYFSMLKFYFHRMLFSFFNVSVIRLLLADISFKQLQIPIFSLYIIHLPQFRGILSRFVILLLQSVARSIRICLNQKTRVKIISNALNFLFVGDPKHRGSVFKAQHLPKFMNHISREAAFDIISSDNLESVRLLIPLYCDDRGWAVFQITVG